MSELLRVEELQVVIEARARFIRPVDGVSFALKRGETLALLGESGCGKSVTALSLMRLLPETGAVAGGEVWLGGEDLLALPESAMRGVRGRRMAMIFQEPQTSLNPVLTVGEQITEVLSRHKGLTGEAARARALAALEAVHIPDAAARLGEYPFQLSGGMKQRVMIAMALAGEPDLLIADEPTTALDVTIQAQVLALMKELQRQHGMAMLLITHDLGVVAETADRVAVMYAGQIVEQASCADFFREPRHPYSQKLFASLPGGAKRGQPLEAIPGSVPSLDREFTQCRFADRCDRAWERCHSVAPQWTELSEGQGVRCHLYQESEIRDQGSEVSKQASQEPGDKESRLTHHSALLTVNDLRIHFPIRKGLLKRVVGQVKAVDGVSLNIAAGRTLALVGESGCGKTTVGKGLLRLLPVTGGGVCFDGANVPGLSGDALRRYRKDVQIIFQDPFSSLNPRMRVGDILAEGMISLGVGAEEGERRECIQTLLEQVGLAAESVGRYPHEFSGGQRQRIAIARALAVNPRLIICDEPTSALDVSVQAQILNLLKELQERLGLSYLFITHNISVVKYLAHEVAVMYLGRIVESGPAEAVLSFPCHPYTRALLSAVPVPDPGHRREVIRLGGDLPSPANPPQGCHFHPRCPHVMTRCHEVYPAETRVEQGQVVHCHLFESP